MTAAPRPTPGWLLVASEAALVAVTLAMVVGFTRVFTGGWLAPLAATAVVAHGCVAVCRRLGWPVPAAAAVTAVATGMVMLWLMLPSATTAGVPTGATASQVADAVGDALTTFRVEVAPVPAVPGLLLAAGAATVVVAFLSDWAALRLWATFEALAPAATVFVFATLVGDGSAAVATAAAFATACVAFVLIHHQARLAATRRWMDGARRRPGRAVAVGAVAAAVAVVAGAVVGPVLPGAGQPGVVDLGGGGGGPGQRVTVSPLVDIRGRLVERGDEVLFTVDASAPAYWRMTSLETFDGAIWKSSGSYRAVRGDLDADVSGAASVTDLRQRFSIDALSAVWLPAAWQPDAIDAPTEVRWHPESGTLMVDSTTEDSNGLRYEVRSRVARWDPDTLRAAERRYPADLAATYLALPPDVTPVAGRVAQQVTAGATTDYDRARALQDWFVSEFTYDLDATAGHDSDAINDFLARRSGYCEQFAGTFAVMARTLGIPARVAVGFTPGEPDPANPAVFVVRGRHAHAWPEVWIAGAGWVGFEPTPGRGEPGAEGWTGRPAAQDGPAATTTTSTTEASAPTDLAAPAPPPASSPPPDPPAAGATTPGGSGPLPGAAVAVGALAVAVGGWLALVAAARARVRRWRHHGDAPARVGAAWADVGAVLASVGLGRRPSEPADRFVHRVSANRPAVADDLATVGTTWEVATFAAGGVSAAQADRASAAADRVVAAVEQARTPLQRVWALADPAPVVAVARRWWPQRSAPPGPPAVPSPT